MSSYYDRQAVNLDGTPIFTTPEDIAAEEEVAKVVEQVFDCKMHRWGMMAAIDWYATRQGRVVSSLELKTRTHATNKYDTVFLNCRKWFAMQLAQLAWGHKAVYVVKFTDGIYWINLNDVDPRRMEMGGCARIVKSSTDYEPVILVPVAAMKPLKKAA